MKKGYARKNKVHTQRGAIANEMEAEGDTRKTMKGFVRTRAKRCGEYQEQGNLSEGVDGIKKAISVEANWTMG